MRGWREEHHRRDHKGRFTDNPGGAARRAADVRIEGTSGWGSDPAPDPDDVGQQTEGTADG